MSAALRRALGVALAAATTLGIVGLSRVPWAGERTTDGELRLAWRFKSEQVRQCRKLTAEEQGKLPAHMRLTEDCQRGLRPYRLVVAVDEGRPSDDTIRARGAESDRPLFVFQRRRLAPGRHAVRVVFEPLGVGARPALALDTVIAIRPLRAVLVTNDEDAGRLVVRAALP